MVEFRGSTQEKSAFEIFRFGCRKAANDKMVPDRVGPFLARMGNQEGEEMTNVECPMTKE
jgi:hypothetical protein